jgi:hypothetical protein
MRLISFAFLMASSLVVGAGAAQAQRDAYSPPPVDYADPGAPPAPLPMQAALPGEPGEPAAVVAAPRRLRVDVGAYVEVEAGVSAELAGDSVPGDEDVLTYTSVAAGVDGQVQTRRVSAGFSYRYERRMELNGDLPDDDVHSGIAQARVEIAPRLVSVEAGGLATRTGGSGRAFGVTERDQTTEVYAGYAGPTLTAQAGPVSVNAFYRLGYVSVDDDSLSGPDAEEGNFDTTVHLAGASAGVAPRGGRIGWTVSAGHMSASTSSFDSRFSSQFVRGDVVLPVNPTLALSAGVGYSRATASERDVLRDANGVPIFDAEGNLSPDPNGPRVETLGSDGIYADAGFIWRPTPRSELQLRAGINDDGEPVVLGSAAFQVGRNFGVSVSIYDNDETFGTSLVNDLRVLPEDFEISRDPFTGGLAAGCAFSKEQPGRGVCLSPALQSLNRVSFRERGGSLLFSGSGRLWSWGGGVTYVRRDTYVPNDPIFATAYAPDEQDLALFASGSRAIGHFADIGVEGFASFFDSEAPNRDVTTLGGRLSFSRSFLLRRLQLLTALGLTHRSAFGDDSLIAEAILGLRYTF